MKNTLIQALFLLFLAVGVIFFNFTSIPANLSWDELEFARLALSLNEGGYQVYSPMATGHATLYFYILLAFLKVFGTVIWALRLPAAIFGVLNVLLIYFLFRQIFKNSLYALSGAALLATTRWYITFARFSFEATFLLFLELSAVLLLVLYFQKKPRFLLWISAFFTGLAFHSYYPGRIFAVVPIMYLLLLKKWKETTGFIALTGLVMAPLIIYLAVMPDIRVQQVSVFAQAENMTDVIKYVGENAVKVTGMFIWEGDGNGRHNFPFKPALNPIQLILAGIGFVLMIIHRKTKWNTLFLIWGVVAILPSLFTVTYENPNMLRTVTDLPAIIYAIVLAVERIVDFSSRKKRPFALILIICFLVLSQFYDLRTYFTFQSRVSRNSFEITCPLKESLSFKATKLGDIPPKCRVTSNMF